MEGEDQIEGGEGGLGFKSLNGPFCFYFPSYYAFIQLLLVLIYCYCTFVYLYLMDFVILSSFIF